MIYEVTRMNVTTQLTMTAVRTQCLDFGNSCDMHISLSEEIVTQTALICVLFGLRGMI